MKRRRQMSDWARIERSRELRLWTTQVIAPIVGVCSYIWMTNEDVRNYVTMRVAITKARVQEKYNEIFHKEKEDGRNNNG